MLFVEQGRDAHQRLDGAATILEVVLFLVWTCSAVVTGWSFMRYTRVDALATVYVDVLDGAAVTVTSLRQLEYWRLKISINTRSNSPIGASQYFILSNTGLHTNVWKV